MTSIRDFFIILSTRLLKWKRGMKATKTADAKRTSIVAQSGINQTISQDIPPAAGSSIKVGKDVFVHLESY